MHTNIQFHMHIHTLIGKFMRTHVYIPSLKQHTLIEVHDVFTNTKIYTLRS